MTSEVKKIRRKRPSSFPSILSISLVLFLLGLLGILIIDANKISEFLKENIILEVYFHKETSEEDILKIKADLDTSGFVRSSTYISKDEAAKAFQKDLGQDFIGVLGYNPLLASVEIKLKAEHAMPESVLALEKTITGNPQVREVTYQKSLLEQINKNVQIIGTVLIALSLLFLIIAITLINNTIRLTLFAKRFIIKSMQFVGATEWFIIKPFLLRSLLHGVLGAFFAGFLLGLLLFGLGRMFPEVNVFLDPAQLSLLFVVLMVFGILIVVTSTYFSTKKYLKIKIDDLY